MGEIKSQSTWTTEGVQTHDIGGERMECIVQRIGESAQAETDTIIEDGRSRMYAYTNLGFVPQLI